MLIAIFKSWFAQKYGQQQYQYSFSVTGNRECIFPHKECIVAWMFLFTTICVFKGVCARGKCVCDGGGGRGGGEALIAPLQ